MLDARTRLHVTLAVGFLGICVTGILFFTVVSYPSKAQLAGFYSLVLSEVVAIICIACTERPGNRLAGAFVRSGIYTSTLLYLGVTALVALVFMSDVFADAKWLYALHGVCLCLLCVGIIIVVMAAKNMSRSNADVQAVLIHLKNLENRLGTIRAQNPQTSWSDRAARCQEEIRFFDTSRAVPADALLRDGIERLEQLLAQKNRAPDEWEAEIRGVLEEVYALTTQRNAEAKNPLAGQF